MQLVLVPKKMEESLDLIEEIASEVPEATPVVVRHPHPEQIAETAAYVYKKARAGKEPETFIVEEADIGNDVVLRHIKRSLNTGKGTLILSAYADILPEEILSHSDYVDASY